MFYLSKDLYYIDAFFKGYKRTTNNEASLSNCPYRPVLPFSIKDESVIVVGGQVRGIVGKVVP